MVDPWITEFFVPGKVEENFTYTLYEAANLGKLCRQTRDPQLLRERGLDEKVYEGTTPDGVGVVGFVHTYKGGQYGRFFNAGPWAVSDLWRGGR